jgi:hypothetical protein
LHLVNGSGDARFGDLAPLVGAGCRFWNLRATKSGAFEEYYPWEQGYPPLAFSSLAVAKIASDGGVPPDDVAQGMRVAARQLLGRFESEAGNQQVAGLAALAWIRQVFPEFVPPSDLERLVVQTLGLQTEEGWFVEYGGPDLGYLTVTMDLLWDLFDATGDERFVRSCESALKFTDTLLSLTRDGAGMHNSRNTDYLAPYSLFRFGSEGPLADGASRVLSTVFGGETDPLLAVDDRYVSHYLGHSVIRATGLIERAKLPQPSPGRSAGEVLLKQSGHYSPPPRHGFSALVSLRKGAVFTIWSNEDRASDYGWRVKQGSKTHVTHWWGDGWSFEAEGNVASVKGSLVATRDFESTPMKHLVLRLGAKLAGRRLIRLLKRLLVFRRPGGRVFFSRKIEFGASGALVVDELSGLDADAEVVRAPRASKRHVASADSYHPEDLEPVVGFVLEEERSRDDDTLRIETRYSHR